MELGVSRAKQEALTARMRSLGIREQDIEEKFIRSSGPGGQKVNKTSTCVYLSHKPTGIEVKCQKERSQALNRFLARQILVEKIASLRLRERLEEIKRAEKLRRKMRKRSKREKEKMLEHKKKRARKKKMRSWRPGADELDHIG